MRRAVREQQLQVVVGDVLLVLVAVVGNLVPPADGVEDVVRRDRSLGRCGTTACAFSSGM
jgi:hypothetical protein